MGSPSASARRICDPGRRSALECGHRAGHSALAGLCRYCLQWAHASSAGSRRKSALQPVGPGVSQQPAPAEDWIAIPVPAIVSQEAFDVAQARLDQNKQMARRNNDAHDYLLRGLVSCGQCRLACTGRNLHPGYPYYVCRGRTDALRVAYGEALYGALCASRRPGPTRLAGPAADPAPARTHYP